MQDRYRDLIANAKEQVDILGLGLGSFHEDYHVALPELLDRVPVRMLLLDPSFSLITDDGCLASIREGEERLLSRQIRHQVDRWREFAMGLRETKHPLKIRVYRAIPMVNLFKIDNTLFFGSYLYQRQSRETVTFEVSATDGGFVFAQYSQHFEQLWTDPSTRNISAVLWWEVEVWREGLRK